MNLKPEAIRPIDIHPVDEKELLIQWQDGHRSLYGFSYLRRNCRCAACVDEWTGKQKPLTKETTDTVQPLQTSPVGNYAIRFHWSDGHSTGIYSFELLRSICPCKDCLSQQK